MTSAATITPHASRGSLIARFALGFLGLYFVMAYIIAPALWRHAESRRPEVEQFPRISHTKDDIPGDPLNLALVGSEEDIARGMQAAGWHPADPITLRSSLRIAEDTVLRKPDPDAPVSNLYVWGHKQDLAYEFPVGHDPRRRHHVRFWKSPNLDVSGRPLWVGSATYDERVGLSHTTGQITHHIGPDVDKERDNVLAALEASGSVVSVEWIDDFNPNKTGRNGGGDPYCTDGRLPVIELKATPAVP